MRKTTEGKKARPAARARLMAAIAVCAASALALEPPAAFAATDPIAAVDNLSTFIFGLIRSVGLILLGHWYRWYYFRYRAGTQTSFS